MSARKLPLWKLLAVLILLVLGNWSLPACVEMPSNGTDGTGQPDTSSIRINVQVDAEREDTAGISRIIEALKARSISTTVFVSADYANANALLVHDFFLDGFEIALHGYSTGEQLASMTYEDQKDLLERAMLALRGCEPCGTYKPITGFRPQYFSQNEDTYRILDEIGLTYDSGFKAGQIFIEGHEEDTTPYPVEGHSLAAVPLTTIEYKGKRIYLCDIACALVEEMTADEWSEALRIGLAQCVERQEPMALILHGWYTGDTEQYDYWQPFVDFLDEAAGKGVFVGTQELVDSYSD
jgi:peptidoglycan/xylan/chitin deacetylase (PgdA/CDA1 family)